MKKFKRLIFIDDEKPNNVFHKIIIDTSGLCDNCIFFEKPQNALKYIKKHCLNNSDLVPDVVFLDLRMPVMSGWDFLEEYAKLPALKTKIVLLTSSDNPNDIEKAKLNGFVDGYVKKPLKEEDLRFYLNRFLSDA